jgi:hypothetical protein
MGGVTIDGGGNLAQIVFLASIIAAGTDPRISVTELKHEVVVEKSMVLRHFVQNSVNLNWI